MGSQPFRIRVAAMTHQGHVRPYNEDCIGLADWNRAKPMQSPILIEFLVDEPRICVVADGLGGHSGGEVASILTVRELAAGAAGFTDQNSVSDVLHRVNKRLYDIMTASTQYSGMGATVVGLAMVDTDVFLFNVGDSRGYVRAGNFLRLLSRDDSVAGAMIESSERTGQVNHNITQSLGGMSSFQTIDPFLVKRSLTQGERYLLCSDGLTDMLDLDAIENCLADDPKKTVSNLVGSALAAGGADNISVMIIDSY